MRGPWLQSHWNMSFQLGVLKRGGESDVAKEWGKKGGRKAQNWEQPRWKEWEKLRDDATCPKSSFVSHEWDFGLFKSFVARIRAFTFCPRRLSLSHVYSSRTIVVSIRRHDSKGCIQNEKSNWRNYLLNSTLLCFAWLFRVSSEKCMLAHTFVSLSVHR